MRGPYVDEAQDMNMVHLALVPRLCFLSPDAMVARRMVMEQQDAKTVLRKRTRAKLSFASYIIFAILVFLFFEPKEKRLCFKLL